MFGSGHCQVINLYNNLDVAGKPLLYFSLEYPLAPGNSVFVILTTMTDAKYPAILDSAISAYYWLVQNVGIKNIVSTTPSF